ncbi:MAG: Lrp/AsnC family transcriptional regulator [Eubacterium sp.]|nr:Lrp/AsnC family transcriptional regulator [Eubacterium sp.]
MKNDQLDAIDKKILQMLQVDARTPVKDIAQEVFLTAPAVSARINHLIEEGYITGFHATINPQLLGYHIKSFINLEVDPKDKKDFYAFINERVNVVECNCVTGDYSMLLEVMFKSTNDLDQFIGELQSYGRTKTLIVFSTLIEHREIIVNEE